MPRRQHRCAHILDKHCQMKCVQELQIFVRIHISTQVVNMLGLQLQCAKYESQVVQHTATKLL